MKLHVAVIILCGFTATHGFNVETKHCTIYAKEYRSMFGFSVAEHQDRQLRGWVIVGAPEAQSQQPGVYRGGEVYRCDINEDNSCSPITFDPQGNQFNANVRAPYQADNKTLQWFGATVSTSQIVGGPILACAPRYLWHSANFARREPVGTCYITEHSFNDPKEFSPCRTRYWGYHRQGSCQAGLGAALSKDGQRVLIGAPGSYYWQGQVYSVDSHADFPYIPSRYAFFGDSPSGQAFSGEVGSLPRVVSTKEGRAVDDDSYLGYSVATGDFEGDGVTGSAVGMPRGDNLLGKVLIFTSRLTMNQKNLTGEQMGAYFGYSVIATDVDGDGLDDLIVGAPMYTIDNPGDTFETGRVHIFYQGNGPDKFSRMETRTGFKSRSRFGLSLAALNDIDRDGYSDFAVGAPYDGPSGRGAVYVYHGSRAGVLEEYSQVIYAEALSSPVSTFGFSISGGLDLDGNQYPDIVVGAYESNTAAFFRSRPVIKMEASVTFLSNSKSISLDDKSCTLNSKIQVPCLQLETCLTYTGIGVQSSYEFNVEYALDTKKTKNRRLFFIDNESRSSINRTVRLSRDQELCREFKVYVTDNIKDKLTSIDAEMRMSLIRDYATDAEYRNPKSELTPVLGATTSRPDSLSIFKSCGTDNICVPNLELMVKPSVQKYLLGSGELLELDVLVENKGEDAYESLFYLKKPVGIEYMKIERIDKTESIPVQCSAPAAQNNFTLLCDIGNPLPDGKFVHFKVLLQPVKTAGLKSSYEIDMGVNTTNPEAYGTEDDNKFHLSLPIWIQTELVIEGTSRPKELYFNSGNYTTENITNEWEFGPLLTHNYTIRNDGPSEILAGVAWIDWPASTHSGEELLYLIEQPETAGPITCATANANYLSLALDQKRRYQHNYAGNTGGFSGGKSGGGLTVEQIAEEERRKKQEEQYGGFGYANSTRDYDTDAEIRVTSNSSRGGYGYTNYTERWSSSGGSEQRNQHESSRQGQQSFGNQYESSRQGQQSIGNQFESSRQGQQSFENQQREQARLKLEQERRRQEVLEQQQSGYHNVQVGQEQTEQERRRQELLNGQQTTFEYSQREERLRAEQEARDELQRQQYLANQRIEAERRRIEDERAEEADRQRLADLQRAAEERRRADEVERERLAAIRRTEDERQRTDEIERERLAAIRRTEDERQRTDEIERERLAAIRRTEDERQRTEYLARQRLEETRRREEEQRRYGERPEVSETYGVERHWTTDTGNNNRYGDNYGTGTSGRVVTEEHSRTTGNSGLNFGLTNIGSSQDLEKFFSNLKQDSAAMTTYIRDGKEYVQFDGRFRLRDGKELIQFRNGQTFDVLDRYGDASYSDGKGHTGEYSKIEGQFAAGEDGYVYIELSDGRKFRIPGTYTYERKQTFTVGGSGVPRQNSDGRFSYGRQVTHQSNSDGRTFAPYNNNYREESYEQNYKSEKKVISGGGSSSFETSGTFNTDDILRPTDLPDRRLPRYRRESDVIEVEQFLKYQRKHKRERDLADMDFDEESEAEEASSRTHRDRRDDEKMVNYGSYTGIGDNPDCKAAKCVRLQCSFGALKKGQEVLIRMRYRVKAKTLNEIAFNEEVKVSTKLTAKVTRQEYIVGDLDDQPEKSHEITTLIRPGSAVPAPDVVPLWVVVLSACAGTIILLLLIFLLYKVGFFKRNRPNNAPERQPLNRNGYSNDD